MSLSVITPSTESPSFVGVSISLWKPLQVLTGFLLFEPEWFTRTARHCTWSIIRKPMISLPILALAVLLHSLQKGSCFVTDVSLDISATRSADVHVLQKR